MASQVLWEGVLEKKGRDFFGRWSKRKVLIIGDECRYYETDGFTIKGVIKIVETTTWTVNGSHVQIKTIGRPEKKREANGRDFELKIPEDDKRNAFLAALRKITVDKASKKNGSKSSDSSSTLTSSTPINHTNPSDHALHILASSRGSSGFVTNSPKAAASSPSSSSSWGSFPFKKMYTQSGSVPASTGGSNNSNNNNNDIHFNNTPMSSSISGGDSTTSTATTTTRNSYTTQNMTVKTNTSFTIKSQVDESPTERKSIKSVTSQKSQISPRSSARYDDLPANTFIKSDTNESDLDSLQSSSNNISKSNSNSNNNNSNSNNNSHILNQSSFPLVKKRESITNNSNLNMIDSVTSFSNKTTTNNTNESKSITKSILRSNSNTVENYNTTSTTASSSFPEKIASSQSEIEIIQNLNMPSQAVYNTNRNSINSSSSNNNEKSQNSPPLIHIETKMLMPPPPPSPSLRALSSASSDGSISNNSNNNSNNTKRDSLNLTRPGPKPPSAPIYSSTSIDSSIDTSNLNYEQLKQRVEHVPYTSSTSARSSLSSTRSSSRDNDKDYSPEHQEQPSVYMPPQVPTSHATSTSISKPPAGGMATIMTMSNSIPTVALRHVPPKKSPSVVPPAVAVDNSHLSSVAELRRKLEGQNTPVPATPAPVSNSVAELRKKLELQKSSSKDIKDTSSTKKVNPPVPARGSLVSAASTSAISSSSASKFNNNKSNSNELSNNLIAIDTAPNIDNTAANINGLRPPTGPRSFSLMSAGGGVKSSDNTPVSSPILHRQVSNSSNGSSNSGSNNVMLSREEVETKRLLANKLVEDALKGTTPCRLTSRSGSMTNTSANANASTDSNSLRKLTSDSKDIGSNSRLDGGSGDNGMTPVKRQYSNQFSSSDTNNNNNTNSNHYQDKLSSSSSSARGNSNSNSNTSTSNRSVRFHENNTNDNNANNDNEDGDNHDDRGESSAAMVAAVRSPLEVLAHSRIAIEPLPSLLTDPNRVKLTHTKAHKRMSSSGAKKMYAAMLTEVQLPSRPYSTSESSSSSSATSTRNSTSNLAERKKILASPFNPKNKSDDIVIGNNISLLNNNHNHNSTNSNNTTNNTNTTTPQQQNQRSVPVKEEESLEIRMKRIELEEIGIDNNATESDNSIPMIPDGNFLAIAKRLFVYSKTIEDYWKKKNSTITSSIEAIEAISFPADITERRQLDISCNIITSFDDLYKAARAVRPFFNQAVKQAAYDVGITDIDNCSTPECLIYLPPLKMLGAAVDKAVQFNNENYPGPPESYLYDIVRGRVLCLSESQICEFIRRISIAPLVRIVQLNNRFVKPAPTGYRDLLLVLQVEYQGSSSISAKTSKFFCELQITHFCVHKLSIRQNKGLRLPLFDYFKSYFTYDLSSEAIKKRLFYLKSFADINDVGEVVSQYHENTGLLYTLAQRAINSNNIEEMRAMRELFAKLDISTGEIQLQRAILQLVKQALQSYESRTKDLIQSASQHDVKSKELANEIELLAKLLVHDPDADISEISGLYLQVIDMKGAIDGSKSLSIAKTMLLLSQALEEFGDYTTAKTFVQGALRIRNNQLPPEDRLIGECYHHLGTVLDRLGEQDEAIAMYGKAIKIRCIALGKEHPDVAITYTNLAISLDQKDHLNEAEDLLRDALEILRLAYGDQNLQVAEAFQKLASTLYSLGQYDECKEILEESIAIRLAIGDPLSVSLAEAYKLQSNVLRVLGKYNEAKPIAEEALKIFFTIYGQKHPSTTEALYNVGILSDALGKYDEADHTFRLTLKHRRKLLGNDATEVAETLSSLSSVLKVKGQIGEAESTIQEALQIYRRKHGEEHPMVIECMVNLANIYKIKNGLDDAKALYDKALEIAMKVHGRCHLTVAQLLNNIGVVLKQKGDVDGAKRVYEEALVIRRQICGKDHPNVAESLNNLAVLHKEQGRFREAKGFFEQALSIYRKVYNDEHEVVAAAYNNLAGLLYAQDPKSLSATKFGKTAVEIATKVLGESHPTTQAYKKEWS
eukprot:gene2883-5658_t